jgi:hypothetical protein
VKTKRRYSLFLLVAVLLLTMFTIAADAWPATLTVINNSDKDVYIRLEYPYTFLRAPAEKTTRFAIERDLYPAVVTYCDLTNDGMMDLNTNLRLVFTECTGLFSPNLPKFLGERGMEKVNWNRTPPMDFQFQYEALDD